jgi:hypothetical protein
MDNSGVLAINRPLIWGAKVNYTFRYQVVAYCNDLGFDPDWLMAVMAFETGETFRANIRNYAGSGAVGLIQFMPQTAQALGTSIDDLVMMDATTQLQYVYKFFLPRKRKLRTLEDVYMAVLWPPGIGQASTDIIFHKYDLKTPKRYVQNAGLDYNKDGYITKGEACARVWKAYERGKLPEFLYKPKEFTL